MQSTQSTMNDDSGAYIIYPENGRKSKQLQFEQLITELSVKFINVAPEQVNQEIMSALQQVLTFFQFDRFGLLSLTPDKKEVLVSHACYASGIDPVPEQIDISQLFPWAKEKLLRGEYVYYSSLDELPPEAAVDRLSWQAMGVKSHITIPILVSGSAEFLIAAHDVRSHRRGQEDILLRLRLVGEVFGNALIRCRADEQRVKACNEILALREKLKQEAEQLQVEIKLNKSHEGIIGRSVALAKVLGSVELVAPTDATVLIVGETGTGKELVAKGIHQLSPRGNKSMVKVNCASLPPTLVESELFGREKGAYTGALTRQAGRFEAADGTSIFLDEIAELSLELQAKLLRVLQEGQFERLGSTRTIQVNVRVIAATNRNLSEEVKQGRFREDLYYRLNVFQVEVPPLRERIEDIPLLAWAFVSEFGEKMGKKISRISKQDMAAMQTYSWPGNIRELRNIIEHAVIVCTGDLLHIQLPNENNRKNLSSYALADVERQHILDVL
ncbi:MAG TPA: sigma-54 dependent transcriptional regulator, partial [Geobacteraceae bacterium]|nr:sigma-54 dependent transcriptional regulator [Geobacteraceae bacterium]